MAVETTNADLLRWIPHLIQGRGWAGYRDAGPAWVKAITRMALSLSNPAVAMRLDDRLQATEVTQS